MGTEPLDDLLIAAGEAPPDRRILLRDPIAAFGAAAIARLSEPVWITDQKYAAFALRTIAKAGELGARDEAIAALRRASSSVTSEVLRADIAALIVGLGGRVGGQRSPAAAVKRESSARTMSVEELAEGRCYRRRDLHDAGLGGNRQTGISYPSRGTYCLLFSDPSKDTDYGYRDAPDGDSGYRYFGRWDGTGDMTFSGGNQAILDRTPELYLFTEAACGKVYRGRFECLGWDYEPATRDGRQYQAIVFRLHRVS